MALTPGTRLGVYEVTAAIGEGGMGQVFRARDTKLNREVALKVLPDSFLADAERLARFTREAQTLASLNHPNIAHLHGLEESGGVRALVMELVEGEDLSMRIGRGALPVDEAIPIAKQIATALEAAHDQGIIHRDLKPANVKVRPDGTVKVLDFGLAKALDQDPKTSGPQDLANSPTITSPAMTMRGVILGTAAYMSPEQAAGKAVDRRSDIWSFGAVLWEMLVGRSLFGGAETVSHVVADVLRGPIDFTKVPAGPLRRLLQRCLDRDVKTRLRDIGEARIALERASLPDSVIDVHAPPKTQRLWMVATAVMAAVAGVALWGWLKPVPSEPRPLTHFISDAPQGIGVNPIAVSADGSRLAFANAALNRIFIRSMDNPLTEPVPGTQGGTFPVFSPDGQSLAFFTGAAPSFALKKVLIAGGTSLTLAEGLTAAMPITWGGDGNILLGGDELRRIPEAGGKPVTIAKVDAAAGEAMFASPELLPGGRHILASVLVKKEVLAFRVVAVEVATGVSSVLLDGVGESRFVPTGEAPGVGHLVYAFNGSLFAAAFDAATLRVGPAAPVLEGLRNLGPLTHIGFSASGTLAYAGRDNTFIGGIGGSTLMWVDRQGNEQTLGAPPLGYADPRISPDGTRVAFVIIDPVTFEVQVWVRDLSRGTTTRLTFDRTNWNPVWTPDGKRLVYQSIVNLASAIGSLEAVAADGSGQPVRLLGGGSPPLPTSVSPDGKRVIGVRAHPAIRRGKDIWTMPLESDARPEAFLDDRFDRGDFQFSPDGKWVAYESNETGRYEIYVVPYPDAGAKTQVSTDGGTRPRWNRNGRELFFRAGAAMMAIDVESGAAFRARTARRLFEKVSSSYDVAPDGRRFLMLKPSAADSDPPELHVILNWFDDLRKKVPLLK